MCKNETVLRELGAELKMADKKSYDTVIDQIIVLAYYYFLQ